MVLGYFIITEIDIRIPVQPPIRIFLEKIEHFTEFTGYGYRVFQHLLLIQYNIDGKICKYILKALTLGYPMVLHL